MANGQPDCKPHFNPPPPANGQQRGKDGVGIDTQYDALSLGGDIDSETMAELKACLDMPEDPPTATEVEDSTEVGDYDFVYQTVVNNPEMWNKVPPGRARLAITRMAWIGYASNDWTSGHWQTILFLAWREPETRLWIEGAMQDAFWTKKRRETWEALAEKEAAAEAKAKNSACGLTIISPLEVKPRAVRWLWPGLIALGRLSILIGVPNTGKSTLMRLVCGQVASGRALPNLLRDDDNPDLAPKGRILWITAEEDAAEEIVPSADVAGLARADFDIIDGRNTMPGWAPLYMDGEGLRAIRELVVAKGYRLIVFDGGDHFMPPKSNANTGPEVRQMLGPWGAWALNGQRQLFLPPATIKNAALGA